MLKEAKLYNETITLKFDDEKHKYWDEKGNPLISNTGATSQIDKSGPLMGWAVKEVGTFFTKFWDIKKQYTEGEKFDLIERAKKEFRYVSKKAKDIGKEIHEWVEEWIKGEEPKMPEDEKVVNGITAFLKYQKKHKSQWLLSERLVYSKKHKVGGTMDAVELIEAEKSLCPVDFKSSSGVYDDMVAQMAGYQMMLEEELQYLLSLPFNTIKDPKDKILIRAYKKYGGFKDRKIIRFGKEDGEFEVKDLKGGYELDRDFFLGALAVKIRRDQLRKEWIENNKTNGAL